MDVVTHTLMAAVASSPWWESDPVPAAAFVLGAALPDLDVLSRLFGKRAFLRWHQTFSHSLVLIVALLGVLAATGLDPDFVAALGGGMLFHVLLDVTNTYGITLLAPFSMRRTCLQWVFFIDAFVILLCLLALAGLFLAWGTHGRFPAEIGIAFWIVTAIYWGLRAALRVRVGRLPVPGSAPAFVPGALLPWRFLGYARDGQVGVVFRIDALTGEVREEVRLPIRDPEYRDVLNAIPEVIAMRELSPAYHLVGVVEEGDRTRLTCRDLRTRNFGGRFGTLEVAIGAAGEILEQRFHV